MHDRTKTNRPLLRALLGATAVTSAGLLALPSSGSALAQEGESAIESARDTLGEYVETRRLISKERKDWNIGREVLQDRVDVVKREIDSLQERMSEARDSIAEADEKREELAADNERLEAAVSTLFELIADVEARTTTLLERLPDPIVERVRPFTKNIPEPGKEDIKQSLGQRFQNVVAILNEVNKFNREVSIHSEVRQLADGQSAEVTSLYIGIGQGYYVTSDGAAAGVGTATAEGWAWQPANAYAAQIAEAIAIHRNEKPAAFVRLPLSIQ